MPPGDAGTLCRRCVGRDASSKVPPKHAVTNSIAVVQKTLEPSAEKPPVNKPLNVQSKQSALADELQALTDELHQPLSSPPLQTDRATSRKRKTEEVSKPLKGEMRSAACCTSQHEGEASAADAQTLITMAAAEQDACPAAAADHVHIVSLRLSGSDGGKKVLLPQSWESLLALASSKLLDGAPVGAICDADGDELVRRAASPFSPSSEGSCYVNMHMLI